MSFPRSFAAALAAALLLSTASVASASQADLLVSALEVVDGVTKVGATATYRATAYSYGPDTTDVTVTDTLGEAEQFVSATTSQGTCTQAPPAVCSLGALPPGVVVEIRITVRFTKATDANVHKLTATGAADNTDPDPTYDTGAISVRVTEPAPESVETPRAATGSWERTQSTLEVDAELSPFGTGTYFFEYGKTKSYGSKTPAQDVTGQDGVKGAAVLRGLTPGVKYHYRVVLVVAGRSYRGENRSARTFGRLKFPDVTLVASKRSPNSTRYTGVVGGGIADAPGACKGKIVVQVYTTANVDLLARTTKVDPKTCKYAITIPFGTRDARARGKKGSVLVQARFSGTRFVAAAGSESDRP